MRNHQNQIPHPYLAPGRFLTCALSHGGRRGQVGLWPKGCKPDAKISPSSDSLSILSHFPLVTSYHIPPWRQGRFLACALPHGGREGQVGLWPRGCKLSTKVSTSYSSSFSSKILSANVDPGCFSRSRELVHSRTRCGLIYVKRSHRLRSTFMLNTQLTRVPLRHKNIFLQDGTNEVGCFCH